METQTEVNGITYINITQDEPEPEQCNCVEQALVEQLNHEFHNYRFYKTMSGICDAKSLLGACSWFDKSSIEEQNHFNKIYSYMLDRNMKPTLTTTEEIQFSSELTLEEIFTLSVELEYETTLKLITLKKLAIEQCDYQTVDFLDWFLLEQVEEEKLYGDMLKRVRLSSYNLLIIDKELGER